MEPEKASIRVRERVKLIAWEDSTLSTPVLVDLTFAGHAPDLESLSRHINISDLLEAVRQANGKLPPDTVVRGPEEGETEGDEEGEVPANPFRFPEILHDKRYVFPSGLEKLVQDDLFKKDNLGLLRPLMIGRGEGKPLAKMGMLGRAANEENSGTSDAPFYYATVLQLLRFLSERAYGQLLNEGKVAEINDDLRSQFQSWTAGLAGKIRHTAMAERLLSNPLAPYAIRRQPRPLAMEEAEKQYLSVAPNNYRLTFESARELDSFMDAQPGGDEPEEKAAAVLDIFRRAVEFRSNEHKAVRRTRNVSGSIAGVVAISWSAVNLLLPWDPAAILSRLTAEPVIGQLVTGLVLGAVIWFAGLVGARLLRSYMRNKSPAWKEFVGLRERMSLCRGLCSSLAQAVALGKLVRSLAKKGNVRLNSGLADAAVLAKTWKKSGARICRLLRRAQRAKKPLVSEWLDEIPSLMSGYRKLKADEGDYALLSGLTHPSIDFADGYQKHELKEMWLQNACVCYEDDFPTLIIGKAATASVYFMDVTGSTEMSTKGNLSNALARYSRVLTYVNETGIRPLWRKEMGDGRFYCHPNHEALKRAVITAQGCAHPSVGVGVGIGFSVGEIYTDVRTGDFQNEVTNRASRLNSRDDTAGSWIAARYARHPLKVHVKFGKLYNRGIAMDEKALNAFEVPHDETIRTVPPFEWKFPVMTEMDGRHSIGSVSFLVARIDPSTAAEKLAQLGETERFAPLLIRQDRQKSFKESRESGRLGDLDKPEVAGKYMEFFRDFKAFEVFCHLSDPKLHYVTPAEKNGANTFFSSKGAGNALFVEREAETEIPVVYKPISLPTGETVMVIVKREKTHLRGLGYTAIAEVDIPSVTLQDPSINISEFLSKS